MKCCQALTIDRTNALPRGLKVLNISGNDTLTPDVIGYLPRGLEALIAPDSDGSRWKLKKLTSLTHLDVRHLPDVSLIPLCLEHLYVRIYIQTVPLSQLTNLRTLHAAVDLTTTGLAKLPASLTDIKDKDTERGPSETIFSIAGIVSLHVIDVKIEARPKFSATLRHLVISAHCNFTDDDIGNLPREMLSLEIGGQLLTDDCIGLLPRSLHTLKLSGDMTDYSLADLPTGLTKLQFNSNTLTPNCLDLFPRGISTMKLFIIPFQNRDLLRIPPSVTSLSISGYWTENLVNYLGPNIKTVNIHSYHTGRNERLTGFVNGVIYSRQQVIDRNIQDGQ